jgi:hypothetical protein
MNNIDEIAGELKICTATDDPAAACFDHLICTATDDPVAACFDHFAQMSEDMRVVTEHIKQKCSRYTLQEERHTEICDDPIAETPLIGQLQEVNIAMAGHLRSLEDLRNRLV